MVIKKKQSTKRNKKNKIRIILADKYPLIRKGLKSTIEEQEDLTVIAEASNGHEVIQTSNNLNPDIIIMDENLPEMDMIYLINQIKKLCPVTKLIILTEFHNVEHLRNIMMEGASDYITKKSQGEEIVHLVRSVIAGINPFLKGKDALNENIKISVGPDCPVILAHSIELSEKEVQILKCICRGYTNKKIAAAIGVNESYIKAIISSIFLKLGAESRAEAISIGLKSGILTIEGLKE